MKKYIQRAEDKKMLKPEIMRLSYQAQLRQGSSSKVKISED